MTPSFYKGDYEDVKATSLNSHAVRQGPGNGERAYHDWIRRAQTGEEPYAAFFDATRRARDAGERDSFADSPKRLTGGQPRSFWSASSR
ncbi:MAG: hypothetical protein H0U88_01995 [Chthoniobacterales bacterium]|nr:hypothetical protein [Chthoniobacterales bacterium]